MNTILETVDIARSFGGDRRSDPVHVLKGVSLSVRRGEMVTIVGPSGSGKSTLLQCMSGLDAVSSGEVTIAGTAIGELDLDRLPRSAESTSLSSSSRTTCFRHSPRSTMWHWPCACPAVGSAGAP